MLMHTGVAEGVSTLPGQPELVIVEAVSSSTLKVSWQRVQDDAELAKIDGYIIQLAKLSSFEDTISAPASMQPAKEAASTTSADSTSSVTSSTFSSSTSAASSSSSSLSSPLANLTLVDVSSKASLATLDKLLQASTGTISLKIDKSSIEFAIDNLKPYTVYQIQMFAYNARGRSQLTDAIRALTLAPDESSASSPESSSASGADDAYVEPTLPDTRKCCMDKGVTLKRCLDTLCDPVEADRASIADLMICAPWSNATFSCLASHTNHTNCCKARGVSPFCLSMCSGDVKRVDYRHFRCLTHMSSFTNCVLESHNVLPSAPRNFTVGPITSSWAVLNWRAPNKHARSLQGYRIFWRRVEPANNATSTAVSPFSSSEELYYSSAEAATNPYLLDALSPSTVYETFVVAVNKFGQSESSSRFIFQTLAEPRADGLESRLPFVPKQQQQQQDNSTLPETRQYYNETACCMNSGVRFSCLSLCDYDMRVTDVSALATTCNTQMPAVLRCLAGARNSVPCCRTRGVSEHCLNVCAGLTEHSPLLVAARCASDFGRIISCMDESSKQIPGAPIQLRTVQVMPDRIEIAWSPAPEDAARGDIEYHVRYQQLQPPAAAASQSDKQPDLSALIAVVPLHPLEHNLIQTTNSTQTSIDKLEPNARYSVYVTAENRYGISLPSLVLVVQTPPRDAQDTSKWARNATIGAPHSLEILRSDTETIVLKWIAPLFVSSDAQLRYRVFYKYLGSLTPSNTTTTSSAAGNNTTASSVDASSGVGDAQQVANTNWTVMETGETSAILRQLRYTSQYVITVQAFNKQQLGHMSEILIAATARPVPPTLNHPLVINAPVEGNNITLMCVALGQPTPQISMFINGMLVQRRTQPYVIYHLVNLARGHLTITCLASNGHGKDYASVQSRTEVSVRFASKAVAKRPPGSAAGVGSAALVQVAQDSSARLSCEVSGNPQPTVIWTFVAKTRGRASAPRVIVPNERVSTLLVSQFDAPFTWLHTLTISNVSAADYGRYECRAKNQLAESSDFMDLDTPQERDNSSTAANTQPKWDEQSDLWRCCKSQNVSVKCLPVCAGSLDVEAAFRTPDCQPHLDKLMYCAADGSDHRTCCRARQVPGSCMRWCSGAKPHFPPLCFLSAALDINQCFTEGRTQLPGSPRNLRVTLASSSSHANELAASQTEVEASPVALVVMGDSQLSTTDALQRSTPSDIDDNNNNTNNNTNNNNKRSDPIVVEWDAPIKNADRVQYYRVFWRAFGSRELSRTLTNSTWIVVNNLSANKSYEFVVKAANQHGSSVYSEPLTVRPADLMSAAAETARDSAGGVSLTWLIVSRPSSLFARVLFAMSFATLFMFGLLGALMVLERRGYLRRFASSKSNSSRISFANPTYLNKDNNNQTSGADTSSTGDLDVGQIITWDTIVANGHSLDVLGPAQNQTSDASATTPNGRGNPRD